MRNRARGADENDEAGDQSDHGEGCAAAFGAVVSVSASKPCASEGAGTG